MFLIVELFSHNMDESYMCGYHKLWEGGFMRPSHKIPFDYLMDILDSKSLSFPTRLLHGKVQSMNSNSSLLNK